MKQIILFVTLLLLATPALAAEQQRASGDHGQPIIQQSTANSPRNLTPQQGLGGNLPHQNIPQNSTTQSAGEEQKKLHDLQVKMACQKTCHTDAIKNANYMQPLCQNGLCSNPKQKKKWTDLVSQIEKNCQHQHHCE